MFIGYLSSFFIALLLSLFYLSYAASGIFERIRKEIKNDNITTEIIEESHDNPAAENSFTFDYFADIPALSQCFGFSGFAVDIPLVYDDIPPQKIHLSEYFLRPPPYTL
jgi:hypothetical protein